MTSDPGSGLGEEYGRLINGGNSGELQIAAVNVQKITLKQREPPAT